jgi:hypothetical protein
MKEIISAINHALDCGRNRLQWYTITRDEKHMKECKEWNEIASIYMNQLIMEQKNETCKN